MPKHLYLIVLPQGRRLHYIHRGYSSVYEKDLLITIAKGKVTGEKLVPNPKALFEVGPFTDDTLAAQKTRARIEKQMEKISGKVKACFSKWKVAIDRTNECPSAKIFMRLRNELEVDMASPPMAKEARECIQTAVNSARILSLSSPLFFRYAFCLD